MKQRYIITFCAALLFLAGPASAQALDPAKLAEVRSMVGQIRHPDQVDIVELVRSIVPTAPELYLMAIADEQYGAAATRLRALGALSQFSQSSAVRAFLESRMGNAGWNDSSRQMAVTSYVRAFYAQDKAGVEAALARLAGDSNASVRTHAQSILSNARKGAKHPAGEAPQRKHSH